MTPTIKKLHSEKYKRLFREKLSQLHEAEDKLEILKIQCRMRKIKNKELRAENLVLKSKQQKMEFDGVNEHNQRVKKVQTLNERLDCAYYYLTQLSKHNKQLQKKNEQLKSQNQNSATSEEVESLRAENRSLQYNNMEHHANIEQLEVQNEMH